MAIQFARCEYVSRSTGGNACRKASYNQREVMRCERTGELFSFQKRGGNAHHEVLLPEGAHEKFKDSGVLWNEVELSERRINSQLAKEFVLALPDDAQVTLEDRIELTRRFGQIFVDKGVAVQLDVHAPHDNEKNWHAHLLVTTRRFADDGLTLGAKARDLDPTIKKGLVVEANMWGEVWRDLQNDYFQEKGYDLCVDPIGIVPQEHLGPVRMRHHLNEAVLRAELLQKANEKLAQDPEAVLEEMTRNRSVFTQKDVELFLRKHVPENEREGLLERVLENPDVLELYHKETKQISAYFTTTTVRAEEEKLLRFAGTVSGKTADTLSSRSIKKGLENKTLTDEQKEAFDLCVSSGQNFNIIQGRAGVGKSYVINAIREAHEASGYRVMGLAPTNKVAQDLKNDGFRDAKTCHSFLFAHKNNREKLDSNTVVIVDEAGMLGTTLSVELLNVVKNNNAKLILVGDDRQLSSVERGGTFQYLSERYGAATLKDVRRQSIEWQKTVSESLAEGNVKTAVHLLEEHKAISWSTTKEESLAELLNAYAQESLASPQESRLILTRTNVDVDALNHGVRDILRAQGRLGEAEIVCPTQRGRVSFTEGDRIQLTTTDKAQGLMSASFGTIEHIDLKTKTLGVRLDNNELKAINPNTYNGLRHGYASTVYQAQGATLDHVSVLHSSTTNQSTNYVALTRQAKSLQLYVSHDETPSQRALIHQMERAECKRSSLTFHTLQDFEKKQEERSFGAHLKQGFESLVTKVKDTFHRNGKFYRFEKPANSRPEKAEIVMHKAHNEGFASQSQDEHAAENKEKIAKAQSLWNKGWPIQGTLAEQYLREHRKIEGDLPGDLRYLPAFKDGQSQRSFPCLMAGARSSSGEITAVQLTFLDPNTKGKADVEIAKKSFGVVKGSGVTLQKNVPAKNTPGENKTPNILFIAEGVETALSLKSAGIQGNIKASLGLSNIKRLVPEKTDMPIVICADHDAPASPATQSLQKSVASLQMSGYSVRVIKPNQLGDDFNDVLKKQGPQGVRQVVEKGLRRENFLEKEQVDKVFAKELPAAPTPTRELSAERLAIMARIAREQELQGYGSSARAQFSSPSFREQKPHLKEINEMELDMER